MPKAAQLVWSMVEKLVELLEYRTGRQMVQRMGIHWADWSAVPKDQHLGMMKAVRLALR